MKRKNILMVAGLFLASTILFMGCNELTVIPNRGQARRSVFEDTPLEGEFEIAASPDETEALEALRDIEYELRYDFYKPKDLAQNFHFLLKATTLTDRARFYCYYLFTRYPMPHEGVLSLVHDDFRSDELMAVEVLGDETISGTEGRWAVRAFSAMMAPELDRIYGPGVTEDDIEKISLKEHEMITRKWLEENAEFLYWSESKGGFSVNRRAKERKAQMEREAEEEEARNRNS